MGASLTILTLSGLSTLFLVALFIAEDRRGVRFGEGVRAVFDRMLSRIRSNVRQSFPEVNDHFFQELFYFLTNRFLAFGLSVVRRLERGMLTVARFNKMQVARLRSVERTMAPRTTEPSGHLAEVMDHKRSVELTPKERAKKKEEAIGG